MAKSGCIYSGDIMYWIVSDLCIATSIRHKQRFIRPTYIYFKGWSIIVASYESLFSLPDLFSQVFHHTKRWGRQLVHYWTMGSELIIYGQPSEGSWTKLNLFLDVVYKRHNVQLCCQGTFNNKQNCCLRNYLTKQGLFFVDLLVDY